ncbi:LytR/AlgR family response regulator transcription factor [Desulfosporosinus nitroreducens]|uniref:Stage 0 sporulation protein A homolog n=1 Tax=Desulfosporosinus nitroreducens TaxID=2018668 RepID=A0ABT8QVL6_9FIRM|nr:LytTR family transcriptional regulator DNA-binding domain-containing protein [Desulfosporosinus nitroreducens]MCO1602386.1 LytTR family transcriptional regulator DNA-binding domain-containing protein [Desulfosporosinus nitroreducens]MDO0824670.1 LytTR family transcriptional regulator DNA-binding domain-containing protein [Desulfosporosinus nitroreducens]
MISVVIADDEPLARDELIYLLKQCGDIKIVGEATQGAEALEKILTLKPDVAFLDIQMPNLDGLTVARKLLEEDPALMIVFATAYDKHAIQAFEVNAIDYLLKPFDEERVLKTVERIRQRVGDSKLDSQNETLNNSLVELLKKIAEDSVSTVAGQFQAPKISKLAVQGEESVILIDPKDILYVYRETRDVFIKTSSKVYSTKYTLQTLEEKLASYPFFRPHRSYLVNLNFVQELVPWFNGAYTLILNDEKRSEVPVSRAYVKALKDLLEI